MAALAGFLLAPQALAQSTPPPATYYQFDERGVDVTTGAIHVSTPAVSIGQPGMGGLAYQRSFDSSTAVWRDNVTGTINSSGTTYTVTLMGQAEAFTYFEQGSVYTPTEGTGGRLTLAGNVYTYTTRSGAVALFDKTLASSQPTQANEGRVTQVTMPSGERLTFTYTELRTPAAPATPTFLAHRLQSLTNNLGYQLSFEYQTSTADATGLNLVKVTAINNAVEYCAPTANVCSLTQSWPYLSYGFEGTLAAPTARNVTDALDRVTRYAMAGGYVTGIRRPGSAGNDVTITYNGGPSILVVASVTSAAGTWTYNYTYSGPAQIQSVTVTDPLSHTRVNNLSDVGAFLGRRGTSYFNGAFTTIFTRDTQGRLTRVTAPDGSATEYTYDLRGNTTQVKAIPTVGADIVTTAAYPPTCTNPVTCNLPTSTTDARGFRTDYTYDPVHGGVLTVTAPAPTGAAPIGSGMRPQNRTAYAQQTAQYIQAPGGSPTAAPTSVYRPTQTSSCASTSSCAGGADETVAVVVYNTAEAPNLQPWETRSGSGNGTLTAITRLTYDDVGNLIEVDGPLSADNVHVRYDALRRRVGAIGPDPDGAGSLKHRATRYSYNAPGVITTVERGTVDSPTDPHWDAFSTLEQVNVAYDGALRRARVSYVAGGATQAVTQYSYDGASRLDCVAVRMNPAVFGSLPASACALGTEGPSGPDRIARTTYDNADRPLASIGALGTSAQQTTAANTYVSGANLVATLTDASGNVTTYEYDGFDRLRKIRFPNASGGGSSLTDYEQYTYDAGSNVTQDRRRDGATISFAYDNLSRATTMTPSSGAAVTYAYDNFSRPTQVSSSGHTLSFAYDQLSRNTSATGPLGTVSYQYDLAGRRTRVTWPGSPTFYSQYDYDVTGAVTAIRENGAASGPGVLASYTYDDRGRRTSVTRGNGVVTTYDFDAAGRLEELAQDLASTGNDVAFNFAYNVAGQAISQNRTASNSAYTWTAAPSVGNYTNNGRNQIASLNAVNFSYDSRGNLTATGSTTYTYDIYNRLTGAGSATLAYDPAGRLYQTALGAVGTRFLYDGANMIAEYDDDSPTLLRRFVHGPGVDEPVVWYEGAGTSDRRWLVQDRLGSVIAVTDGSGAPLSINAYDEYGLPSSSNAGRFQYTGQMWIAEAGVYHYKARAYAPSLGRFLQSDPILYAGGMNLYAYVGNDPLNGRDPSGLDDEPITPGVPCPDGIDDCGTIVVTAEPGMEDWVKSWRLAMDARLNGRLAELFKLLDKINWDQFCAQHSCLLQNQAKQDRVFEARDDPCVRADLARQPYARYEMRRFNVEEGIRIEVFPIIGAPFELDQRLMPVMANYRYTIDLVTAQGRSRRITGGLTATSGTGATRYENTGPAWIESLTVRSMLNRQSGQVRICVE